MFLILLSLISVSVADLDAKGACALQTKHRLEEGAKKVSVTCSADELICYDSTGHTQSCHPKSAGCPVTCPAGEHVCHTPAYCDTCDGYNWCSMSPCPLYCSMNETLCHDSTTMTDSCHPKSAGCPVTCPAGEHVCHTPPYCGTCDGYNWCSSYTCPLTCGMDEIVCHDSHTMTESCHPMSTGCPVTCAAGEHVCHSPATCETCHGYSWCSSYTCPLTCGMDEILCHDSHTMTESCHPMSTGCPVTCAAGEHVCHSPATCETCHGYSWCSMSPCPITCGMDEILCHDSHTMTDSCHPVSTGCPVTCAAGEHLCHSPPTCEGCHGYDWCSPSTCPITCGMDEIICHDSNTMTESCHLMSTGCPVTCAAGEYMCNGQGYNWCSTTPCPVTCSMDEILCHDSTTMTDSCYPMSTGCPVTCAAGEYMCNGQGYNWCSMSPCPITCGMDEILCHDSTTMTDSCYPMSTGCPVTCLAGEHVCHSPPTCEGCHGYSWCSPSTCPITCGQNEMACWDSVTMTDSCYPMSTGCPVTCAAGEYMCSVPATCAGCTGYSYCSMTPCTWGGLLTCGTAHMRGRSSRA